MKKSACFIAVLVALLAFYSHKVSAQESYTSDGFTYVLDENTLTASISATTLMVDEVVVPSNVIINNISYQITAVASEGFANQINITKIALPDTMETLGINSFYGCSNLKTISLGKNLKTIFSYAFYNCIRLETINIPQTVTLIGDYAFGNCQQFKNLTLPSLLQTISNGLFYNCWNIESLIIPNQVISIGDNAFLGCRKLFEINLSANLRTIGNDAFADCISLKEITIPQAVTAIGDGAFGRSSLEEISLPNGVQSLGTGAFLDCVNLKTVVLPDNNFFNTLSTSLFQGCINLDEMVIPKQITTIETTAFSGCQGLTKVTFNGNINNIGQNAFYGCLNLTMIIFKSAEQRVPYLGENAFYGLTKVNFFLANDNVYQLFLGNNDWKPYIDYSFIGVLFVNMESKTKNYREVDPVPDFSLLFFNGNDANNLVLEITRENGENIGVYNYLPALFVLNNAIYKILPDATTTATLTIIATLPNVAWPVYNDLFYGQSITDITVLEAGSASGIFSFDDTEPLTAGLNERTLTFRHDDPNYLVVTKKYSINVIRLFVTFIDDNGTIYIDVLYGADIPVNMMPEVTAKLGYNGSWEIKELTKITDFITVNAVYLLKTPEVVLTFDDNTDFMIDYDGIDHCLRAIISHEIATEYIIKWYQNGSLLIGENDELLYLKNAEENIYRADIQAVLGSDYSSSVCKEVAIKIKKAVVTIHAIDTYIIEGDNYLLNYEITGTIYNDDSFTGALGSDYLLGTGLFHIDLGTLSLGPNYELILIRAFLFVLPAISVTVVRVTDSKIEVLPLLGVEYSIDGINFDSNNTFIGLRANTNYTITARYQETADFGLTEGLTVKTKESPIITVSLIIIGSLLMGNFLFGMWNLIRLYRINPVIKKK